MTGSMGLFQFLAYDGREVTVSVPEPLASVLAAEAVRGLSVREVREPFPPCAPSAAPRVRLAPAVRRALLE